MVAELEKLVGQIVFLVHPQIGAVPNILSRQGDAFVVGPNGFYANAVQEVRKIEVDPNKNAARAVIVLNA